MQGVKQICPSVVIVIVVVVVISTRSQVLGIFACSKHNGSVDVDKKIGFYMLRIAVNGKLISATNRAFSV